MLRKCGSVLVVILLGFGVALAQTVDDLVNKHLQARGGQDKIRALQSMKMTGKVVMVPFNEFRKAIGPGNEAPLTITAKRPQRVRMELGSPNGTMLLGYDGENAWGLKAGATEPDVLFDDEGGMGEMMALVLLDLADLDGPLVDVKSQWRTVELDGREGSGSDAPFRLKLTPREGMVRFALIDGTSGHVVQTTRSGSDFEVECSYSDFKNVGDLIIPHSIEAKVDGETFMKLRLEQIELGAAADDSSFKPQAAK
jgi:hypothetical protein